MNFHRPTKQATTGTGHQQPHLPTLPAALRFLPLKFMKQFTATTLAAFAFLIGMATGSAQSLQLIPTALLYADTNDFQRGLNWQSSGGVPLSSTANSPSGSDGRIPSGQVSPTPGQFQGVVSYAAVTMTMNAAALDPSTNFAVNAEALDWPRSKSGGIIQLVLRAQAGGIFVNQQYSLFIGSIITPPAADINGLAFTDITQANTYWAPEPFTTNNHATDSFYWSKHANKVFAIQPGQATVTWRRNQPLSTPPSDFVGNENIKYARINGNYYQLLQSSLGVSDGAAKLTRKMYWTEGIFSETGKKVSVPSARVKDIHLAYYDGFPQNVASNEVFNADSSTSLFGPLNPLQDTRTLWFENGLISANNKEGRIFLELLGEFVAGDSRVSLGYEIVDVTREPSPSDVTVELGQRLTAFPGNSPSDSNLHPYPIVDPTGTSYVYQHFQGAAGLKDLFATRVTRDLNDSRVTWLEDGIAGVQWPSRFVRYQQIWPADVSRYSQYIRPTVVDDLAAQATAVEVPLQNLPTIESEDTTDRIRSKLTPDSKFYTFLDPNYPDLRTLLRYNSGNLVSFELVFSWLDANLTASNFTGTVATQLSAWDSNTGTMNFPDATKAPRIVNTTAPVGRRLMPPAGEVYTNKTWSYIAGHVQTEKGSSYSLSAYQDPFVVGLEAAVGSSIIPVNASNNNAGLEVWWYRPNSANEDNGFLKTYWPSIVSRYNIYWPTNSPDARDLVLASNAGSGPLSSVEGLGGLYVQNDPSQPGYNPNEEHALIQGGQVWALRDDLNITNSVGYSSHPYVLLEYADTDGRPSMSVFHVLREKGNTVFEFTQSAGSILQAPMPLPLMEKPLGTKIVGTPPRSLNTEVKSHSIAGGAVVEAGGVSQVTLTTSTRHFYQPYEQLALQSVSGQGSVTTEWLFTTNSTALSMQVSGVISDLAPQSLGVWTSSAQPLDLTKYRFNVASLAGLKPSQKVMVVNPSLQTNWIASISATNIVSGSAYVEIQFASNTPAAAQLNAMLVVPISGLTASQFNGWRLAYEPLPASISDPATRENFASFTFQDRKGDLWFYRGPHQDSSGDKMVMQFYYKTLPGFYFPSLPTNAQPAAGTITPYLRSRNPDGSFYGDPVFGDLNGDNVGDANALGIVYHPVWPAGLPVMMMAETLTVPKRGLAAIRGQSSVEVLYQQPQFAGGLNARAVALHDPTREKQFNLGPASSTAVLGKLPASLRTSVYQGLTYFPNLAPHLMDRFFFDPNRGANGALVFKGQFKQEIVGESYLLLNVLGKQDTAALKALCTADDPQKSLWDDVISNKLRTSMELFGEDAARPGTYKAVQSQSIGPASLAEVNDQDVAVDSYALTAMGPGTGYVTLVSGNGSAFTDPTSPVSLQILQVVDTLYRGQLKVVNSSNPLGEIVTLQQIVDLAGKVDDFEFQWLIAAPVNGVPPLVYQNTPALLLGNGTWNHIRHPLATDMAPTAYLTDPARVIGEVTTAVIPVSLIPFVAVTTNDNNLSFTLSPGVKQPVIAGAPVTVRDINGTEFAATVASVTSTLYQAQPATNILVTLDYSQTNIPTALQALQLYERAAPAQPQSILTRSFQVNNANTYSQYYLSIDLDPSLQASVYLDGQLVANANTGTSDTATSVVPGGFSPLSKSYLLNPDQFGGGISTNGFTQHQVAVLLYSGAQPGSQLNFNLRLEAYQSIDLTSIPGSQWLPIDASKTQDKVRAIIGTGADVRALSDNYLISRYRTTNSTHASFARGFSQWTEPQLAEGWIKRVLNGINPFNQRVTDLFNNQVNTDVSILTQAGTRWEGDVALNLNNLNNSGLIEIYETVLRRGRAISIDSGINYGPANDALLLASSYLNDLYMGLGNEAWADAANPTIGIGTKDPQNGAIATALFSFKGEVSSLLEEELALLRGRDDFLQPGVQAKPVYNRLFWNYTRGIDSGEVIYALNYDIQPLPGQASVGAAAAAHMFPQGHGDAYGHYLTALKDYLGLFISPNFDWVPHPEAVTVLGQAVAVNYQNERKFAAAAAAVARAGSQVLDLTWRKDYVPGGDSGWESLSLSATNTTRSVPTTRYWGVDQWASRTMQGAYYNWTIGNAILPAVDPDPTHEGIQKVDRTTVPELQELPSTAQTVQISLDNAEGHFTPLGLPAGSLEFDINPSQITGVNPQTHFEQIYARAVSALNNAVVSFDDAKDVTRLMRSEQGNLTDYRFAIQSQELAYTNSLIELYGTPYPDDVGPGRTYATGYNGPDLLHFLYVDMPELSYQSVLDATPVTSTFKVDYSLPKPRFSTLASIANFISSFIPLNLDTAFLNPTKSVSFTINSDGYLQRPSNWSGKRPSPGKLQDAASRIMVARNGVQAAVYANNTALYQLDLQIDRLKAQQKYQKKIDALSKEDSIYTNLKTLRDLYKRNAEKAAKAANKVVDDLAKAATDGLPDSLIVGVAAGGDATSGIVAAEEAAVAGLDAAKEAALIATQFAAETKDAIAVVKSNLVNQLIIRPLGHQVENAPLLDDVQMSIKNLNTYLFTINQRLSELDDARRNYQSLMAQGQRILSEREIFRQRTAAIIQGYRTRDAGFRIFRNEKLERYKILFDLASRYAFMAANAYDYETGLLNTDKGKAFVNRIINSRALGVVKDSNPQYAGSNTGDPGLSSALAEMKADWDVLKGRLGFNNASGYGTTVSLRSESLRIVPGSEGDTTWKDALNHGRTANLLDDPDVKRNCLQIDPGNGLPVPGIIVEFSTSITDGNNFFGRPLAGGDHYFDSSYFATKIFSVGVAFEGYIGMDNPVANTSVIAGTGSTSPSDPTAIFLNPKALAATPGVYLIPVGQDAMRSPPLGDNSAIRSWTVNDVTIPLPFNVGGSDFNTKPLYQAGDSLTEPLFNLRKHPAFRPVSTTAAFAGNIYGGAGQLQLSQFTNTRLIGRSVWNTRWKLVIPGYKLLNDPNDGLDRFVNSVTDIKFYYVTYSYSGN